MVGLFIVMLMRLVASPIIRVLRLGLVSLMAVRQVYGHQFPVLRLQLDRVSL